MYKVSDELQTLVDKKVKECMALLRDRYTIDFPTPTISYNLTGTTAGSALGEDTIRLNRDLIVTHTDHIINQTLPHEIAHCAVNVLHPTAKLAFVNNRTGRRVRAIKPHGNQWQSVMRVFGLKAERCHTLDVGVSAKSNSPYVCKCDCMEHQVGVKRYNKILKGAKYRCTKCKTVLQFSHKL